MCQASEHERHRVRLRHFSWSWASSASSCRCFPARSWSRSASASGPREEGTTESWAVFGVAAAFLVVGTVVKYAVPDDGSRPLSRPARSSSAGSVRSSASSSSRWWARWSASRSGSTPPSGSGSDADGAWPSTTTGALRAMGVSILIELAAALVATTAVWITGGVAHVIAVLLALLGAASYGVSDFIGGIFGKRASAWAVAATGGVGGGRAALILALLNPGDPSLADLAWGAAAGVGNGDGDGVPLPRAGFGAHGRGRPGQRRAGGDSAGAWSASRPASARDGWSGSAWSRRYPPSGWSPESQTPAPRPDRSRSGARDGVLAGLGFGSAVHVPRPDPGRCRLLAAGAEPGGRRRGGRDRSEPAGRGLGAPRGCRLGRGARGRAGRQSRPRRSCWPPTTGCSASLPCSLALPGVHGAAGGAGAPRAHTPVQAWGLALCGLAVVLVAMG